MVAVLVLGGLAFFVSWITDEGEPDVALFVDLPPKSCVNRVAARMVESGFVVAHRSEDAATFTRPRRPSVRMVVFLLLFFLVPLLLYLLYFAAFRPKQTTSVLAVREDGETRVLVSGDDKRAKRDLKHWLVGSLT